MTVVIGILAFIFILGAAVVLHEFGHFIVNPMHQLKAKAPRIFQPRKDSTCARAGSEFW